MNNNVTRKINGRHDKQIFNNHKILIRLKIVELTRNIKKNNFGKIITIFFTKKYFTTIKI